MLYAKKQNYSLYWGNCLDELNAIQPASIDMIFADPPYRLSSGGITCKSGRIASVDKGEWDKPQGLWEDYSFAKTWLALARQVLAPNGTIWVSGTYHIIYQIGFAMLELGFHIINDISWFKPNAPPNMACRCFTASHETLLWAKLGRKSKHIFNYQEMKAMNDGKQMRSMWSIPTPSPKEKQYGKHPTQKPIALLDRCILSSTNKNALILDPFCGSGTTGVSAVKLGRNFIGIDLEMSYLSLAQKRIEASFTGGIA